MIHMDDDTEPKHCRSPHQLPTLTPPQGSPLEVLCVFFKLGVSCFGGPIAHIGYFRDEFVLRRRWLDE